MKTVIVDLEGKLSIVEIPKPKYSSKQALTKSIVNAICGSDIHLIMGAFKGVGKEQYPLMLGHENIGEVVEIGSEVKGLKIGDRVLLPFLDADKEHLGPYGSAWGALSEYCVVNDAMAFEDDQAPSVAMAQVALPADLDPITSVMLITLGEVLSAIKNYRIEKNQPVIVYGSGPVALSYIQLLKLVGANPVVAIVRNEHKKKIMLEQGADIVLNSSKCDVSKEILKLYPQGATCVIDAVGSVTVINEAIKYIADRGQICCYGVLRDEKMEIDMTGASYNWSLNFQQFPSKEEEAKAHVEIIKWIREGKINLDDFISNTYKFEDVIQAYEDVQNGKIMKKGIIVF